MIHQKNRQKNFRNPLENKPFSMRNKSRIKTREAKDTYSQTDELVKNVRYSLNEHTVRYAHQHMRAYAENTHPHGQGHTDDSCIE